jgi:aldose 1-epimerase
MHSLLTLTGKTRRSASWKSPARAGVAVAGVLGLAVAGTLGMRMAPITPAAGHPHHCLSIHKQFFGKTFDKFAHKNVPVFRYTLSNCRGMQVNLLTYGVDHQSIWVPSRHGPPVDVILGFKTLKEYVTEDSAPPPVGGPYFGETVGRYANRIAKGQFHLNGKTYYLPINNGVNSLHGGFVGFGNHVWSSHAVSAKGAVGVAMTLVSPNGDEGVKFEPGCKNNGHPCTGYPAKLTVTVTTTLNNHNQLTMQYHAVNDSSKLSTVLNLTNHDYFNLAGEGSPAGSAYSQFVQMNANNYSPTDDTQIPLPLAHGVPVAGTPFDFRTPHTIGSRIDDVNAPQNLPAKFKKFNQLLIAQGYDHNWILNQRTSATTGPDRLNLAARAFDPSSGHSLTVWTDQPGVQFYSGNFLNGTLVGISGHVYRQSAGYTFETQHFPNSPNEPAFPSTVLGPGKAFNSTTIYQFGS